MEVLEVVGTQRHLSLAGYVPLGHMAHLDSLWLHSPGWTTNQTEGGFILLLLPSIVTA